VLVARILHPLPYALAGRWTLTETKSPKKGGQREDEEDVRRPVERNKFIRATPRSPLASHSWDSVRGSQRRQAWQRCSMISEKEERMAVWWEARQCIGHTACMENAVPPPISTASLGR